MEAGAEEGGGGIDRVVNHPGMESRPQQVRSYPAGPVEFEGVDFQVGWGVKRRILSLELDGPGKRVYESFDLGALLLHWGSANIFAEGDENLRMRVAENGSMYLVHERNSGEEVLDVFDLRNVEQGQTITLTIGATKAKIEICICDPVRSLSW